MNVLIVAAHPDDEMLGAGGTICEMTQAGHTVWVLLLGHGVGSRDGRTPLDSVAQRQVMAETACRFAGVTRVIFPGVHTELQDNEFDDVPRLAIIRTVEEVITEFHPDLVFTHSRSDLNVDHRRTHEAVVTATRPAGLGTPTGVYTFEIPSSTEWGFPSTFTPTLFIPINWRKKLGLLECYESEMRLPPHPRSYEAIEALAKWRGATVGVPAAEAFEVIRQIGLPAG